MSFFRTPSLFRADPFFSAPSPFHRSAFPASPFSPLSSSSLFDPFPVTPVSAPLYTRVEWRDEDGNHPSSRRRQPSPSSSNTSKGQALLTKEDRSPSNNNSAITGTSQQQNGQPANQSDKSSTPPSPSSTSTTSTSSPRQMRNNKKVVAATGPSRSALFAPLPSLFSSALSPLTSSLPSMDMSIDMFSTPTAYSIHASVPGVDKGDIKLTVDDGVLTIEAERRERRVNKPTNSNAPSSTPTSTPHVVVDNKQADDEVKHEDEDGKTTSSDVPMSDAQNSDNDNSTTSSSSISSSSSPADSDEVTYHHVESFFGRVSRRVQLPDDAQVDELTAKFEDGMIKITVPRQQEQRKRERRIELQ